MLILKLVLTPLLTLAVSLAARAWGHRASGWLTALPIVAGPIAAVLLIEQGQAFVVGTLVGTLVTLPAIAVYIIVFALMSQRHGWGASLASGWVAFVACAVPLSLLPAGPVAGLAMTWLALAVAYRFVPRSRSAHAPVAVPRIEIAFRMAASVVLMLVISYGADAFGPRVSGVLLAFPIGGSVLPAFTRALHGAEATLHLLRGFVVGMFGFPLFMFVLALALPETNAVIAFSASAAAVVAAHFATALALNRGWVR